jgi:hypothetical protein
MKNLMIYLAYFALIESIHHLFFDCVVAKQVWTRIAECFDFEVGNGFESIDRTWLSNKRFLVHTVLASATLWGIWKLSYAFRMLPGGISGWC